MSKRLTEMTGAELLRQADEDEQAVLRVLKHITDKRDGKREAK